jgi:hypothetical protein
MSRRIRPPMSVGHVRLRDARASLGTPPTVGPNEYGPTTPEVHRRNPPTLLAEPGPSLRARSTPARKRTPPAPILPATVVRAREPTVADRHATTQSGRKEPRRADPAETRRAWAIMRPRWLDLPVEPGDEPAKYTTHAGDARYADHRAAADDGHARGNDYVTGASRCRDRHGHFRGPGLPVVPPQQGRRRGRHRTDRAASPIPPCNSMITCKTDTAASHIAGLDVPYRVIRQAGSPQATNQVPAAREDLGQGPRHPGRSDGEDGVEWQVVMPLDGEANAPT